jgi:hypothetical protein
LKLITVKYIDVLHSCHAKFVKKDKTAHQIVGTLKHFVKQEALDDETSRKKKAIQ